jgi:hypothetical protein
MIKTTYIDPLHIAWVSPFENDRSHRHDHCPGRKGTSMKGVSWGPGPQAGSRSDTRLEARHI